jgi:hypothetical protein
MFSCSLFNDTINNSDYRIGALVYIGKTVEGRGLTLSEVLSSHMSGGTENPEKPQLKTAVLSDNPPNTRRESQHLRQPAWYLAGQWHLGNHNWLRWRGAILSAFWRWNLMERSEWKTEMIYHSEFISTTEDGWYRAAGLASAALNFRVLLPLYWLILDNWILV